MSENAECFSRIFVTGEPDFDGWYKTDGLYNNRNAYVNDKNASKTFRFIFEGKVGFWKFESTVNTVKEKISSYDFNRDIRKPYTISYEINPPRKVQPMKSILVVSSLTFCRSGYFMDKDGERKPTTVKVFSMSAKFSEVKDLADKSLTQGVNGFKDHVSCNKLV